MSPHSTHALSRLSERIERVVYRHVLGLQPDPETWPQPENVSALPLPIGIAKSGENLQGWVLEKEFTASWPSRRTVIGAQMYRFEENGEYDCGWRLVDLAGRYLESLALPKLDIVMIIPPPQVFQSVHPLEWSAERLARRLGAAFRPDLAVVAAPLNDHADRLTKLPVPWGGLYSLSRPEFVFNKTVLLADWRWEKGKSQWALAKLLRDAGAKVVCFAWTE